MLNPKVNREHISDERDALLNGETEVTESEGEKPLKSVRDTMGTGMVVQDAE